MLSLNPLFFTLLSIKSIWTPHLLNFKYKFLVLLWGYFLPFRYFNGQHGRKLSQAIWALKLRYPLPQNFVRLILYMFIKQVKMAQNGTVSFSKSLKLRLAAQTWLGSWKLNNMALGQANRESIILVFLLKKEKEANRKLFFISMPDFFYYFFSSPFPPSRELHNGRSLLRVSRRWVVYFLFLLNGNYCF